MIGLHRGGARAAHIYAITSVAVAICPLHGRWALGYRPARYEKGRVEPFGRVGG